MKIVKMHGLGNDFIIIDGRGGWRDYGVLAKRLCERRLSVGADGLLVVENSDAADIKMRVINADGSEAEMCGNGIRCFAKYVYDKKIVEKQVLSIETLGGVMRPELILEDGVAVGARVDMGEPSFEREKIPMLGQGSPLEQKIEVLGVKLEVASVLLGVPHTVVRVEDVDKVEIGKLGPAIEKHALYPKRTNVNFAQIVSKNTVRVRTWERGAGATYACGTGSCAVVAVLSEMGLLDEESTVQLKAGSLFIDYSRERIFMTGPAEEVFEGELTL